MTPMLFMVRFTDKEGTLPDRTRLLQAHLDWLAHNSDTVMAAGSLRPEIGAAPVGACWIVSAVSREAAMRTFESDPFWTAGIRETVEILFGSPASAEIVIRS